MKGSTIFSRVLADRLRALTDVVELAVPYDRGDVLAAIHREGEVVSTSDDSEAMRVRARLSGPSAGRLSEFIVDGATMTTTDVSGAYRASWPAGFVPPPYPYERLDGLLAIAAALPGGAVDLSIGTPIDPPPEAVVEALSTSQSERGYPSSPGSAELRRAIVDWIARRFDVAVEAGQVAACVGTKEFVGTLPQWLKLRRPTATRCCIPKSPTPPTRWGRSSPAAGRSPCR